MITFPNAKINLGLHITQKRSDGFHNIETIFYPIPQLCDILEVIPLTNSNQSIEFTQSGLAIDGDINQNLCVKAYSILATRTSLPDVAVHLHKQIPMGAGLGGGSADGAFALKMFNHLAEQPLLDIEIRELALELGSDCPFFLENTPSFAKGRGELLEPIDLTLNGYLLIVNPGVHVGTREAYSSCKPKPPKFNLKDISNYPLIEWNNLVINDFEQCVFPNYPVIESLKNKLYELGAVYASMSGSGATVFGIFDFKPELPAIFKDHFCVVYKL